jgi:4-diphosphocytidyl-2-C-methyl-D-erythritol kinase
VIVEKAPAKINLALHVLGRRADGYHELSSIVAFADVGDELNVSVSDRNQLVVSGPFAADVPVGDDNIIWKAWAILGAIFPLPFVLVALTKNLPVASGIGGGSADAAAMLRGLLKLVDRALSAEQITSLARSLGADVPVCFYGKACQMQGIGETIRDLTYKIPTALVLVNPLVSCSTMAVFRAMGLKSGERSSFDGNEWRNDMTHAAVQVLPVIADVLQSLEASKIGPVRMSGSGATCFAEAQNFGEAKKAAAELWAVHPNWWVMPTRIS